MCYTASGGGESSACMVSMKKISLWKLFIGSSLKKVRIGMYTVEISLSSKKSKKLFPSFELDSSFSCRSTTNLFGEKSNTETAMALHWEIRTKNNKHLMDVCDKNKKQR